MAANKIKGLTVEIGGDTTKLGKALEAVNKKSQDLSSELGEINKLLKMDPGNTELLAQKQKVLAAAVSNTSEKLDKLKQAEKQVQEQFERGEVSEAQYRALQREIITTEKKVGSYEKAIEETNDALKKHKKHSDEAGDSAGKLGGALASAAKVGFAAVTAAAGAALGALVGAAEGSREYRTEQGKLTAAFETAGHSQAAATETYKTLQGVLGESDQAVEAANHLAQLVDNEQDLATWTNIATGVYATFGDSLPIENLTEAANETAKTGAITGGLADALNWAGVSEEQFQAQLDACTTEQERQALITETLNGLYSEAADKYRETNAEVIRANEANEAWAASMAEVGAAVDPILTDVKMLGASLLSDFLPGIKEVTTAFRGLLNGDEGAAEGIGEALSGIISQLLDKVVELAPTLVQVAASLVTSLVTSLVEMLPQILETVLGLITQVITLLADTLPQIIQTIVEIIPQVIEKLMEALPQIIQAVLTLVLAIVDALPGIITTLIEALPTVINAIIDALLSSIPLIVEAAIQLLMAIVDAIPVIVEALVQNLPTIIDAIIDGVLDALPLLLDAAIQLFMALVEAIPKICLELIKALPQIWKTIQGVLKTLPSRIWAILLQVVQRFIKWGSELVAKAKTAASNVLSAVVNKLKALPGDIWNAIKSAVNKVAQWGRDLAAKGRQAATDLFNAIVNKVKELPGKMASIGRDIVKGLWNGIKDMVGWIKDKISGFADSVLDALKSFFGVHSPSTETAWMGEMLSAGLAKGITENAGEPLNAMSTLADDLLDEEMALNGLNIDRRLNATFDGERAASSENLLTKLDSILAAIERGQIITLDGDAVVGGTIDRIDSRLGQRRALATRGAL